MVVVDRGGVARVARWDTVALNGPPRLDVTSEAPPFAFTATVRGRVVGPASVTVDGSPVAVADDGSFAADVNVPLLGRDVRVRAVDLLGQASVEQLSVLSFVDLRGLPWLPIIGTATVAIGIFLFARVPRTRGRAATAAVDDMADGVLEEIEDDPA